MVEVVDDDNFENTEPELGKQESGWSGYHDEGDDDDADGWGDPEEEEEKHDVNDYQEDQPEVYTTGGH